MSRPNPNAQQPNPSAIVSRSSVSRPDRKPILPGPIARSARAAAASANLQYGVKDIPTVELGGNKSLFQSFKSLGPNARIAFGLIVGAVGIAGLMIDRNVLQEDGEHQSTTGSGINVRMVDRKS